MITSQLSFRRCALYALPFALLLSSCVSWREPAATEDATPPPGYKPVFLKAVAAMPPSTPPKAVAQISSIDTRDIGIVRLYVHVLDSNGTYYYSGSERAVKDMICRVEETTDGSPTKITQFKTDEISERDPQPVAVALVMDNSGSMGDPRARSVQEAAEVFIDKKGAKDALALVRYDHHVEIEVPATTATADLKRGLKKNGLEGFGGATAILEATSVAIDHLSTNGAAFKRKAVMVFTDGQENSSKVKREELISKSLRERTMICAVDFGDGINENFMSDLAKASGGSYSHIYRTSEFDDVFEDVYRRLRNAYVIEYPAHTFGDHSVTVTLCIGTDTLRATAEYNNTPEVGTIAVMDVQFDHGKSQLKGSSKNAVGNMVRMMNGMPTMTIELRGHTDSTNSTEDPEFNMKLSQQRADAVRQALVNAGIKAERITAKGFGDTVPLASNSTEEGRARNRRTEFIILTR